MGTGWFVESPPREFNLGDFFMHKMTRLAALLAATVGLTAPVFAAGPLEGADIVLDTVIAGSGPAAGAPGINLRLYDLSFLGGSDFDGVKNWVELQVTTTPTLEPTPFDAGHSGWLRSVRLSDGGSGPGPR
jgi:hypothetical protein